MRDATIAAVCREKYSTLEPNLEKVLRTIERTSKESQRTELRWSEIESLINMTIRHDPYVGICLAYGLGQARGYRAAKGKR